MTNNPNDKTDARLDELLRKLPDKPVSSNFTARVMQAAEFETRLHPRAGSRAWWTKLIPRVAIATVVVTACSIGWHQYRVQQRTSMAQSVATVSTTVAKVDPLTDPKVFVDFDAINRMGASPDKEIIALLK